MSSAVVPKLFQPTRVGSYTLSHRVVLAPLTRCRANKAHVHGDLAVEYYAQRASVPGTLLITEATFIAAKAGGYDYVPGIWNDEQVAAWRRVRQLHCLFAVLKMYTCCVRLRTPFMPTDPVSSANCGPSAGLRLPLY